MALTGIQIFKMTPKKNCKECGLSDLYGVFHESGSGRHGYFRLPAYV